MFRSVPYNVLRNICNKKCTSDSVPQSALRVFGIHESLQPNLSMIQYQPSRGSQWASTYRNPIIYEEHLEFHKEQGSWEGLAFQPIKAALVKQNCSVFSDRRLMKFIGYLTRKGKRVLARSLMEETFFEIKLIQLEKLKKLMEQEKELQALVDKEEVENQTKTAKYYELEELREKIKSIDCNPLKIFHEAIVNCTPMVETRPVKRGGATYQVPYPLTPAYAEFRAMKWMVEAVKDRPKPRFKHFPYVMSRELIQASKNEGKVVKRKQDMHRQADANKTYAHYRWG